MDIIHSFLNLVAPVFTFFTLLFFLPPFRMFKYFSSFIGTIFSEDVSGKVVVITGASSGIGEHIAYEYAKRGACLVLSARREKSLQEVAQYACELGAPDVIVVRADVSRAEDCRRIIDDTMNHFGRLDHLVNNAGVTSISMLEEVEDVTKLRQTMDINFWGCVYMTHYAAPYLRYSQGRIIALSSCASWLPTPRMNVYNASKAAIAQFYETLRIEFGSDIGITLVTPGVVESEMEQGKHINKAGQVEVDKDIRDVQLSIVPVQKTQDCAKGIVIRACRGERYVTEPPWFTVTFWWRIFLTELMDWIFRLIYMTSSIESRKEALSKKLVDYTGVKKTFQAEVKTPDVMKKD